MREPKIDVRHSNDGAVMVFVTADTPVYVYRLEPPPAPKPRHIMRGKFEVIDGGKCEQESRGG